AVVVGAEATAFLDRDGVWPPARTTTSVFGGGGLVVRFDDGWEALEAFLDRIDEDRFLQLVGGAPLDPAHDDGALDGHDRGEHAGSQRTGGQRGGQGAA
ncbi:hypothetical protein, partial [Curtobacterium sp. csp3]